MDWLGQARTGNAKQAELGSDMLCSALYGQAGMVGSVMRCSVRHGTAGVSYRH